MLKPAIRAVVSAMVGGMTIEECLRQIRVKAAMTLQLLEEVESFERNHMETEMDPNVLPGLSEACEEIGLMAKAVQDSLSADVLDAEVKRPR